MIKIDLLSVHVPKCAGTSFRHCLEAGYGARAIFSDYADRPLDPASPVNIDPDGHLLRWHAQDWQHLSGYRVVHGHFHADKYRTLNAGLRITFLREPVRRMISHYFFWKGIAQPARRGLWRRTAPPLHRLHAHLVENRLEIEEFARLPFIRNIYTGVFFRDADMGRFDFIGFQETADRDMARLSALTGRALAMPGSNRNTDNGYAHATGEILADGRRLARLRDLMAADIGFYETQRAKWEA